MIDRGDRFEAVRAHLRLSKAEIAERLAVSRDSWRRFIGGDLPNGDTLDRLSGLGISIDWLLTGRGDMLGGQTQSQSQVMGRSVTEPVLLGLVIDGVVGIYRQENQRLPPILQGEIVARIYDDVASVDGEVERRAVLRYALEQLRRDLHTPRGDAGQSKRPA